MEDLTRENSDDYRCARLRESKGWRKTWRRTSFWFLSYGHDRFVSACVFSLCVVCLICVCVFGLCGGG